MAASKLERFQSIVKRCEGLMKGGVMKKKPLWYDIYVKHPPLLEPTITREKLDIEIKPIFYAEDVERAEKFNQRLNMDKREIYEKEREDIRRFRSDLRSKKESKREEVSGKQKKELFNLLDD